MSFLEVFREFESRLLTPHPFGPWDDTMRITVVKDVLEGAIGTWLAADLRSFVSPKIEAWLAHE